MQILQCSKFFSLQKEAEFAAEKHLPSQVCLQQIISPLNEHEDKFNQAVMKMIVYYFIMLIEPFILVFFEEVWQIKNHFNISIV